MPAPTRAAASGKSQASREAPPAAFALYPAQPNPFTEWVTFRFALPVGTDAKLEVFDLQGRRVSVVHDGLLPPGWHAKEWDGRDGSGARVPPGTYFYRLTAGSFKAQRKVTLAR